MNSKRILYAIGGVSDQYIEESAPENDAPLYRAFRVSKILPLAAALAAVIALVVVTPNVINRNPNNPPIITPGGLYTIAVNDLSAAPSMLSDEIAFLTTAFVEMSEGELSEYYGTNVFPAVIPHELSDSVVKPAITNKFGVLKNPDGEVYYDQNSMLYLTPDTYARYEQTGIFPDDMGAFMSVTVSKIAQIHFDIPKREDLQYSDFGGSKVMFATFAEKSGKHFYVEFEKDGVYFQIDTSNIPLDEVVEVVKSYL